MCYTGCRYERTWGESAGECSLPNGEKPPMDAMCSVNEIECENAKLRELVRDLWDFTIIGTNTPHLFSAEWHAQACAIRDRARELGAEVDE